MLAPGEHSEVTLTFAPPAAEAYSARVDFLVNGLWTVPVDVRGEGCEMRLELADGGQQRVELGALPLHQVGARQVTLVNRSRRAVDVSFADAADALAAKAVGLGFAGSGGRGLDGVLRPRESRALEIRFAPTARIRPFSEPIVPIVNGRPRPLLQLAGACVAMEFALEMDQLSFGQAALNTRVMRRLMLQNLGDMPSTFRLDGKMVAPDFTITPLEGYLQPNEDVNLEVTFHPQRVSRDIRYERIPLYVDGQPPLALTLTGMCVEAEAEAQVVAFKTCVRQPAAQSLTVKNPSTALWRIHPVVSDENWSAPEVLEIPAGGSAQYEVTYLPLTMTKPAEEGGEVVKHAGSVFFPLPDGSAILHTLEGEAQPPEPAGTIAESVAAKAPKTLSLKLRNWLQQPQRFRVDIRAPDKEASTLLQGHEYVDVPAGLTREYALKFYSYKEGVTNAEVHFINERTDEYLYYKLELKAEAPGTLQTIELQAPLRQLCQHALPLVNPLDTEVSFTAAANNAEVVVPATLVVPANGKAELPIEWRPLLPKDSTSTLTITSAELGAFVYDLQLKALPAGEQKTLHFTVALGDANTLRFRFVNYLRKAETYKLALGNGASGDFEVEASVQAPAAEGSEGAEVAVDVTFEPSKLGEAHDTLTVSSAEGGEFLCALHGNALKPKPQGPIAIKGGASANITFKNVFAANADFTFTAEPAVFSVAKPRETIPGKKTTQVAVAYKPDGADAKPATGKLTIASVGADQSQWVYYLSGSS